MKNGQEINNDHNAAGWFAEGYINRPPWKYLRLYYSYITWRDTGAKLYLTPGKFNFVICQNTI